MPPIRPRSRQKLASQEGKILLALSDLQEGRASRVDTRPSGHKLTQLEEDSLCQWIISMDSRGAAPSKNWPTTFIKRREELRSRYSRKYDYKRALNEDPKALRAWFATVQRIIDENGIQPEDIYNFDETGFAMGLVSTQKVVTRAEICGRPRLLQSGNRECVTTIEAISADGYSLPLCVIFKAKLQKLFIPSTNSRVRGRFRLLILDGHGSHLTPQFDRICAENDIIPLCMPPHASHLLQPLDIGCFAVVKRAYGRFVSDLIRQGYNHIDKIDFLMDYQHARLEAFQKPSTIQNSFAAAGLVLINAERVLSKLNISLRTPTPLGSRLSTSSSQFTPKTPRTIVQLNKQSSMLKDLLNQRSNSPPSPVGAILNRIIKGHSEALHQTALLAQEVSNLRMANTRIVKKRQRSTRQIPCEEGLSIEEGLQLVEQLNQPVEGDGVGSHKQGELPNQAIQPPTRAPPRCSGCREIGHKINVCKNRYI
ncbi:hypothetical protein PMG11_03229 [Penicillium brasilianum]|uniref:DDE-1 domain-containing protein n=1 Tax=Penicillium brasilianum TaxID=104259 RepID=A0A0F7VEZ6_PENBI|nr:hypothetical protein PMG11_03229 [Penicillium brasilianum]